MTKIKEFMSKKTVFWYFSAVSFVFALLTLIIYTARGGNSYSPVSPVAVALMIVGVILNAVVLFKDFRFGAYLPFIFYIVVIAVLMNTEMLFMSNVFVAVDNQSFDVPFILVLVDLAITLIASFGATIGGLEKKEAKKVSE